MTERKYIVSTSGGRGLSINQSNKGLLCPAKFLQVFEALPKEAIDFADNFELHYFNQYQIENQDKKEFGWNQLSLSEQKIINGLQITKIVDNKEENLENLKFIRNL